MEQKADTRLSLTGVEALLVSLLSRLISALRRREWSMEYPPEVVIVLTGLLKNVLAASSPLCILCIWRVTGGDH